MRVCERQLQLIHCWFTATINTIVLILHVVICVLVSVIHYWNGECTKNNSFIYLQASASHVSMSLESNVVSSSSASAAARQLEPSAPPSDYDEVTR